MLNTILIFLYLFPGSFWDGFLWNDAGRQPQITTDFIISSNHVYVFTLLSILGYLSYERIKIKFVFIYLFFLSISLELLHLIIPEIELFNGQIYLEIF